jgi:hypothetical protein
MMGETTTTVPAARVAARHSLQQIAVVERAEPSSAPRVGDTSDRGRMTA